MALASSATVGHSSQVWQFPETERQKAEEVRERAKGRRPQMDTQHLRRVSEDSSWFSVWVIATRIATGLHSIGRNGQGQPIAAAP